MDLTPTRWSALIVAICAGAFVTLLPVSNRSVDSWVPAPSEPLGVAMAEVARATASAQQAAREYRAAKGFERWTVAHASGRDTTLVHVDRSVPSPTASMVRDAVSGSWTDLALPVSPAYAEVFVHVDSASIPRAEATTVSRRPLEPRRLVDVAFVPPESAGGDQCIVLVRLRGTTPAHLAALRNESTTGICGFFAAFGQPGSGVRAWLAKHEYALARQSAWDVAPAPSTDPAAIYGLGAAAARCLTGELALCGAALGVTPAAGSEPAGRHAVRAAWVMDAGPTWSRVDQRHLGFHEGRFLADAVRDLGAERFARFWQSNAEPTAAFEAAAGMSLDTWTQRWLVRTYGSDRGRPAPRVADVVWLVATLLLLIVVAARARDRVLVERFRAS